MRRGKKLGHRSIGTVILLWLIGIHFSVVQAQNVAWAVKPTGFSQGGSEHGRSVTTDWQGNVIVTGYFNASLNIGGFSITSSGNEDAFIAKYDPNGTVLWLKKAGGSGFDYSYSVDVDGAGNSYITGKFSSTITFDSVTLSGSGYEKMFLAKYDPQGNLVWAKKVDGTARTIGYDLAVDAVGNCVVTCVFTGVSVFGSTSLSSGSSNYNDIFTARFNAAGNVVWAVKAGGTQTDEGLAVAVDNLGNCYVTGYFSGTALFGLTPLSYSNWIVDHDVFLVKYDQQGNQLWVTSAGGAAGGCKGFDLAVDSSGDVFITGYMSGNSITFDSITFTAPGRIDAFLAKYSPTGNVLWARQASGTGYLESFALAVDAQGNSFIAGYFKETATFGNITLTSQGLSDVFVAKYDSQGNPDWAERGGGEFFDEGRGLAIGLSGEVYAAGYFAGAATFGSLPLQSSANSPDLFLTKYSNTGILIWAQGAPSSSSFNTGYAISVDGQKNSFVAGYFTDDITFGSTTFTSKGNTDIYVAKYDSAGTLVWVHQAGGFKQDYAIGIAVSGTGACVVTGFFEDSVYFGNTLYTGSPGRNLYVAKFDAQGTTQWVSRAGGGYIHGYDIALDTAGNSYVTGSFSGTTIFPTTSITAAGYVDIFVAKYDPLGNLAWVRKAGTTNQNYGYGIDVDAAGNCLVTGVFFNPASFDSLTVNNNTGGTSGFLAKYTTDGLINWVKTIGDSAGSGIGYDLATDGQGNSYVAGRFGGSIAFGANTITSAGGADAFLCKYDASGNAIWAVNAGGVSDDHANRVAVDASGNCYLIGQFHASASFGNIQLQNNTSQDVFVAKYTASGLPEWALGLSGSHYDYGNGIATDAAGDCYITGSFWGQVSIGNTLLTSSGSDSFLAKLGVNPVTVSIAPDKVGQKRIQVFPNPFKEEFNVLPSGESAAVSELGVYDLLGRQVDAKMHQQSNTENQITIVLPNHLPAGVYLLRVKQGEKEQVVRLLKN